MARKSNPQVEPQGELVQVAQSTYTDAPRAEEKPQVNQFGEELCPYFELPIHSCAHCSKVEADFDWQALL